MGKTKPRGREAQDSEDEGPETLTLATGAEQAAQRRTEEVQQRRLAKQAEKARVAVATARQQQRQAQQQPGPGEARPAGRSAAAVPEAPAHVLEPLSEDVLAAFAERQRRHKMAGADGGGAAAGGAPGGKKRRAPKQPGQSRKAARTAAAGTTIRVNDRLAVTVRAPVEDFIASGGGGPSEAAVSFRTARLATRHKRSREMLLASRIGGPACAAMKPPREGQHNRPGARRPGLSLDRFAAAKTSTYDKRAVLARKHHLKAQRLRGYRRLLERTGVAAEDGRGGPALPVDEDPYDTRFAHGSDAAQQSQEAAAHAAEERPACRAKQRPADANGAREGGAGTPDRKKGKKFNALEVLARDKAREKEVLEQQEAEAEVAAAERRAAIEAAAAARRAQGAAMRKKNARGQPVMRYRVDSILQRLEQQQQTQQQRRG